MKGASVPGRSVNLQLIPVGDIWTKSFSSVVWAKLPDKSRACTGPPLAQLPAKPGGAAASFVPNAAFAARASPRGQFKQARSTQICQPRESAPPPSPRSSPGGDRQSSPCPPPLNSS